MCEWQECKLGDIADITSSKRIFYSEYVSEGVPFYRSKEVIDKFNKRNVQTELFISEERFKAIKQKFGAPEKDDILLTSVGTLGVPYLVNEKDRFYFKDGNLTWFRKIDTNRVDVNYLFLWLQSKIGQQKLYEITIGSTQPALTIAELKEIDILLPPFPEQQYIASIFSSLDNKIDLLHRQNKTLEAMAETLFRQWFVEEVDEGWEEKPLSSVADFLNGLACQKYPPENDIDKLPVLKIKELRNGFSKDSDWSATDVKPEYIVENGDVIFSWSASLMVKIWDGEKCILNQHLFKVTSKDYPKWFYYQWCKHYLDEFVSISASHATTMGHIKRGDLDVAMVLVPSKEELEEMTIIMDSLVEKLIKITKQIRTLEKLRGTLLPKLMSGDVRVRY